MNLSSKIPPAVTFNSKTALLVRHIMLHVEHARRHYPLKSFLAATARSLRVLVYFRQHRELLRMDVVRRYVRRAASSNLFYHLTHRHYLANFLTPRERTKMAMFHMRAEDCHFSEDYKKAVYLQSGLLLWEQTVDGSRFHIQLRMASRIAQEGDLEVALLIDGKRLHSYKFTWLDGAEVQQPGVLVPWITCCQGLRRMQFDGPAKFNAAFPNNWPKLFCLAAVRGVAAAMGSQVFIGIPGSAQVSVAPERSEQYNSTYDEFWQSMHGERTSRYGYEIPSKLPEKDMSTVPSKHRKRAESRRKHWTAIEQSAIQALLSHKNSR